jgi:hypothetical protein
VLDRCSEQVYDLRGGLGNSILLDVLPLDVFPVDGWFIDGWSMVGLSMVGRWVVYRWLVDGLCFFFAVDRYQHYRDIVPSASFLGRTHQGRRGHLAGANCLHRVCDQGVR